MYGGLWVSWICGKSGLICGDFCVMCGGIFFNN